MVKKAWKGKGLKVLLVVVLMLVTIPLVGCDKESKAIDQEDITEAVEIIAEENAVAIKKKDAEFAREIWSEVTEYSVLAKGYDEELSDKLSTLASTYVALVDYCTNGDPKDLALFQSEFDAACDGLVQFLDKNPELLTLEVEKKRK